MRGCRGVEESGATSIHKRVMSGLELMRYLIISFGMRSGILQKTKKYQGQKPAAQRDTLTRNGYFRRVELDMTNNTTWEVAEKTFPSVDPGKRQPTPAARAKTLKKKFVDAFVQ